MDLVRIDGGPRSAVVVGAGVVGLSTAWFLQDRGVQVTVVDRARVSAGASWGNAGWLSPGLAIPLNEPSVLRYGLRSLFDRRAPLRIPPSVDPGLWRFLLRFARNCTWSSLDRAMRAIQPLNAESLEAFDVLASGGVQAATVQAPITAIFATAARMAGLRHELGRMNAAGQPVDFTVMNGAQVRQTLPQVSSLVAAGITLAGQRFVDPGEFVASLARSVQDRGGVIRSDFEVVGTSRRHFTMVVRARGGESVEADVAVLATGAWLGRPRMLGRRCPMRVSVRAGRGYSFTVPTDEPVPGPIYLPEVRVAATPYRGALRVAGTMEFRDPDAALDSSRIDAIIASARPYLTGVRWDERTDEWVGPRPITHDGRPLIGAVLPRMLYVAAGHGMWGLTQGPITGRLLAEQITTGKQPDALRGCHPLR